MSENIRGSVYVLGDDVDTDQIIPAKHLVYSLEDPNEKELYGRYALSGLPAGNIPFIQKNQTVSDFKIVVAGRNFGCGSSREHAPFALSMAGIRAVVAVSYARIFYRNAVDGGFLIPFESEKSLVSSFRTGDAAELSEIERTLRNITQGKVYTLRPLGDVAQIVQSGGIFEYARKTGMLKPG